MPEEYDPHSYKTGQYSIEQIRKFAEAGQIPQDDINWRIQNVGGMVDRDFDILFDGLLATMTGDYNNLPDSQKKVVATAIVNNHIGKDILPTSCHDWEQEIAFYYQQGLVPSGYVQKRLTEGKVNSIELALIYDNGYASIDMVEQRWMDGQTNSIEKDLIRKHNLISPKLAKQMLVEGMVTNDDTKWVYEHGLIDAEFANNRLRYEGNNIFWHSEIEAMYKSGLLEEGLVEERIKNGKCSMSEYKQIEKYYPSITIPSDHIKQMLVEGMVTNDDTKWVYEHGLIDAEFVNKRLRYNGDHVPFMEIEAMYKSGLLEEGLVEERIKNGKCCLDEYKWIGEHYPSIMTKYANERDELAGKVDTMKLLINKRLEGE